MALKLRQPVPLRDAERAVPASQPTRRLYLQHVVLPLQQIGDCWAIQLPRTAVSGWECCCQPMGRLLSALKWSHRQPHRNTSVFCQAAHIFRKVDFRYMVVSPLRKRRRLLMRTSVCAAEQAALPR